LLGRYSHADRVVTRLVQRLTISAPRNSGGDRVGQPLEPGSAFPSGPTSVIQSVIRSRNGSRAGAVELHVGAVSGGAESADGSDEVDKYAPTYLEGVLLACAVITEVTAVSAETCGRINV
jgi:hypothetical protein